MSIQTRKNFTGSNNIAKPERLPDDNVVDAVNMDFTVGGKAELRAGFSKIADLANCRCILPSPIGGVVVVGGTTLYSLDNGVTSPIREISAGPVAGTLHNNKLYINTMSESLEMSDSITSWAVPPVTASVNTVAGSLPAGVYKVAVTRVTDGKESGCEPFTITVGGSEAISVSIPYTADEVRLYASVADGSTLYRQGVAGEANTINSVVDDSERLTTSSLSPLPFCDILSSMGARIAGASGRFVYFSRPMQPHLHDPEEDYLQFPSEVTVIAHAGNGLYVCAGKTYYISDVGGDMQQKTVLDFGAIKGTMVRLPDGSVTWFSTYGQVFGAPDGVVTTPNIGQYAPFTASAGAAGYIEHNGNQMVTTTMRGEQNASGLQSNDHWDLEII